MSLSPDTQKFWDDVRPKLEQRTVRLTFETRGWTGWQNIVHELKESGEIHDYELLTHADTDEIIGFRIFLDEQDKKDICPGT